MPVRHNWQTDKTTNPPITPTAEPVTARPSMPGSRRTSEAMIWIMNVTAATTMAMPSTRS